MKIILIHPNDSFRARLRAWIHENTTHAVLLDEPTAPNLPASIACHEPDLVVLPTAQTNNPQLVNFGAPAQPDAQALFPNTLFLFLPDSFESLDWDARAPQEISLLMAHAENLHRETSPVAHGYASNQRKVFHSDAFLPYASQEKRHRPKYEPEWEEVLTEQKAKLVMQLQAGSTDQRHERAKRYLSILRRFDRGLQQEMAYRIAHGSYKIAEMRDQIPRWLTVLAHYVGGVDLEHCPGPQYISPHIAFVHHAMPKLYHYPLGCVLMVEMNPAIEVHIMEAVEWKFGGETDEQLAAVGCRMLGINSYLAQVATAQVRVMDQFLDPSSEFHQTIDISRTMHRHLGIFCEFWGLDHLRGMKPILRHVTEGFHKGTTRVLNFPTAPSMRQFLEVFP